MGRPIVGVLACRKRRPNGTSYSRVNDVVTAGLLEHAGVLPVLIPAVGAEVIGGVVAGLDGLVLPGSGSYVHPALYGRPDAEVPGREYDLGRDEVAMALLRAAHEVPGLPVLGSCRGMQELAVHAGCVLEDLAGESAGVHRHVPAEGGDRWAEAHLVEFRPGGLFQDGCTAQVNSQHSQAVAAATGKVRVEAVAQDGVIEALSIDWPERFVVGIQWHFEQHTADGPLNQRILQSFGRACERHQEGRRHAEPD
ncbi:glutamine amidotransferase [Sphaerisporangium siamense]|uniref:Putative glutamine amidotransferase n=1 Tax=Sphaerisporangium siamense TaxID=795645 RepID=A0A7W7G9I2_9ACTN|nr:gamma-glutamyl-gamma-aminobutyrate hydrolase family protein [Sphaerisporangium siamense]MBB4702848.1 putative glutamine amidotransferase [Sphaerisporangium siamense]GII83395.1 glutamine amidotransferase [Sphaerisporangium siamense]